MTFALALFGSKLKGYREQFELPLSDIAAKTGLSEQTLSILENGVRRPTGDEVLILADYYKCDYQFFISNEQINTFEQTGTLFRRHGKDFSKADRWAVQEFLFLCECEEFLLTVLGKKKNKLFDFTIQGTYFKGQGEAAAKALRQCFGYSSNQIGMDIYDDFRNLGFHVFRRQLGNSNISGLFIKHPIAGKCILINYSEDIYRQRFTTCHEAAHAILDYDRTFIISLQSDKKERIEVRANTFASRYLMPPEFLHQIPECRTWNSDKAISWANKLKVSTEALANALESAKLISSNTSAEIKAVKVPKEMKVDPELPISLSEKTLQRREGLLRQGLSNFYVGLCFDAYDQGVISTGRMAEMLLVSERELEEIANIYGRKLRYDK